MGQEQLLLMSEDGKMKKLIFSIFALLMLCTSAFALVDYGGMPSFPYLVFGQVSKAGVGLAGAVVEVKNVNTGYIEQIRCDNNGYWQTDGMNWKTTSSGRIPVQSGDKILIRVTEGCGSGDVCSREITAMGAGYEAYARVDFAVTGATSCPACPVCGGGGGGGSCYINEVTAEKCAKEFPCPTDTTPYSKCDSCCSEPEPCAECPPITAEECRNICEETVCPEQQDCDNGWLYEIMFGIAGLVLGAFGWWSGFKGLVNYRVKLAREAELAGNKAEAQKQYKAAAKMVQTAVEKAKSGEYD